MPYGPRVLPYVAPQRSPEELAGAIESFILHRRQQELDAQAAEDRQRAIDRQERLDALADEERRRRQQLEDIELQSQGIFRGRVAEPGQRPERFNLFGDRPRLARTEFLPADEGTDDLAGLIEQGITVGGGTRPEKPAVLPGQFVPGLGFSPRAIFRTPAAVVDPNAGVQRVGGLGVARSGPADSLFPMGGGQPSPLAMGRGEEVPLPPSRIRQLTEDFYVDESLTPEARAAESLAADIEALVEHGLPRGTATAIARNPRLAPHLLREGPDPYGGRTREQFFKDLEDELRLRRKYDRTAAATGPGGISPTQLFTGRRQLVMAAATAVEQVLSADYGDDEAMREADLARILDTYGYRSLDELRRDVVAIRRMDPGVPGAEPEDPFTDLTPEQQEIYNLLDEHQRSTSGSGGEAAGTDEDTGRFSLSRETIRQARELIRGIGTVEEKKRTLMDAGFTEEEADAIVAPQTR